MTQNNKENQDSSAIDTTSISPLSPPADSSNSVNSVSSITNRRSSLEHHLQSRPTAASLKQRHILLDTSAAPALQAAQHELERKRVADSVRRSVEGRPTREDLVERNVIPEGLNRTAPALQEKARQLEKSMLADNLEKKLESRKRRDVLVHEGILET